MVAAIADDHERRVGKLTAAARRQVEGEHPAPPKRKSPAAMSGAYSDPHNSVVGKAEVTPAEFAGLGGSPSPRQRAARGESLGGETLETDQLTPFSGGD
jgi:hypothetical protein